MKYGNYQHGREGRKEGRKKGKKEVKEEENEDDIDVKSYTHMNGDER